jgi:hypothetical protein
MPYSRGERRNHGGLSWRAKVKMSELAGVGTVVAAVGTPAPPGQR